MNRCVFTSKSVKIFERLCPRSLFTSQVSKNERHENSYEARRVVVTGLGGVTPLAVDIPGSWRRLIDGECAIRRIDEDVDNDEKMFLPIYLSLPSKVAARIPLQEFCDLKVLGRFSNYLLSTKF